MGHLILLGDSILDNRAYTKGGPAVIDQVRSKLPSSWQASLLAVDGSLLEDISSQINKLPPDATHLILSAGGNNALMESGFLQESASSVADVFLRMAKFESEYQQMVNQLLERGLPVILCTIYYPNFPDPIFQELGKIGIIAFNDCILRDAINAHLPVIDLCLVCTSAADYANEIEPSVSGGAKIAEAIVQATTHNFTQDQTTIYI